MPCPARVSAMSGINQHLSIDELESYRQGRLAPADLLAADDHLGQCDLCYGNLDGADQRSGILTSAAAALAAAAHIDHPAPEELFDYADGGLDEISRQSIEAHLEDCSDCGVQAADLASLSLDLATAPGRAYEPRITQSAVARESGDKSPHSTLGPWQTWAGRIGLRIAAVGVFVFLVAWGATWPLRARIARLEQENARIKQSNEELQQQAASLKELQGQIADLTRENQALRGNEPGAWGPGAALSEPAGVIAVDRDGIVHGLPQVDPSDSEAARTALVSARVKVPAELAALRDKSGHLMGAGRAAYGLASPVATIVAEQRPVFKWRLVDHATNYVVSVYTEDSKLVAQSEPLSATEWKPGANLERGQTYTWQVRAVVGSSELVMPPPEAADAKFKVLPGSKVSEMDRAKQLYGGSHLMQGLAYSRLGLLDDAERQFQTLVSANPKSELARKLLASLKSLRPRN